MSIPDIEYLRDLLASHSVDKIATESTSIYWVPIWHALCNDFDVKLVSPYFIKQLPRRKTNVRECTLDNYRSAKGADKRKFHSFAHYSGTPSI